MHREKRLEELCVLYRENRATPEEARELLEYFASRPPEELDKLLRPMQAAFTPDPSWQPPVAPADILELTEQRTRQQQAQHIKRMYRTLTAAAACVILLGGLCYYTLRPPAAVTLGYQTGKQAKDYTLPDGTHLNLLPGSRVTYTQTTRQRILELSGIAWLDVATDAQKPFTIQTGHVFTQILGTSLAIDASPQKSAVAISLSSGSIQVKEGQHFTRLLPNQQIIVPYSGTPAQVKNINVAQQLRWLGHDTLLSNLSYEAIAPFLARRFGVTISFETAVLRTETIHTKLEATETLQQILDNLADVTGSSYRLEQNQVTLFVKN